MKSKDQLCLESIYHNSFLVEDIFAFIANPKKFAKSHAETHTAEKKRIVENERKFFKSKSIGSHNIYLGVVGSGEGLLDHMKQAKELGYDLENTFFFEMVWKYFNDILLKYLGMMGVSTYLDTISISDKDYSITPSTNVFKGDKVIEAMLSKDSRMPSIIHAELPPNGSQLNNNLERARGVEINSSDVTHIDFDITSSTSGEKICSDMDTFFNTYSNLQSLVQVHSWRRKLEPTGEGSKREQDFLQQWEDCIDVISSTGKKSVRKDGGYFNSMLGFVINPHNGYIADQQEQVLKNIIETGKMYDSYVQVYVGGAEGGMTTMISISTVRGSGECIFDISVERERVRKDALGYIKYVKNFIASNPSHPLIERLKQFDEFINSVL